MSKIQIINLQKSFGEFTAVKNSNLTINDKEFFVLLGPSGCGKTTLLKCIVGKLKLNSGSVTVFGQEPGTPDCGVPGRRVGYMPQETALYGEFNIKETIHYFGRINGLSKPQIEAKMKSLTEFLELPDCTTLIRQLSGGIIFF